MNGVSEVPVGTSRNPEPTAIQCGPVWRLRLPLPWPGVPHVNAWVIAAGTGVVLVDTGLDEPGTFCMFLAEEARITWMFTVDRAREKLGRVYPKPAGRTQAAA